MKFKYFKLRIVCMIIKILIFGIRINWWKVLVFFLLVFWIWENFLIYMIFYYRNDISIYRIDLLEGLNEIKYMKCVSGYMVIYIDKYCVNIVSYILLVFNFFRNFIGKELLFWIVFNINYVLVGFCMYCKRLIILN